MSLSFYVSVLMKTLVGSGLGPLSKMLRRRASRLWMRPLSRKRAFLYELLNGFGMSEVSRSSSSNLESTGRWNISCGHRMLPKSPPFGELSRMFEYSPMVS